jgi:hypothetical protein
MPLFSRAFRTLFDLIHGRSGASLLGKDGKSYSLAAYVTFLLAGEFMHNMSLFPGDSKNQGQGQTKHPVNLPSCLLAFGFRTTHNRPRQRARDP